MKKALAVSHSVSCSDTTFHWCSVVKWNQIPLEFLSCFCIHESVQNMILINSFVCLSVCPSMTVRYRSRTIKRVEVLLPPGSPIALVFSPLITVKTFVCKSSGEQISLPGVDGILDGIVCCRVDVVSAVNDCVQVGSSCLEHCFCLRTISSTLCQLRSPRWSWPNCSWSRWPFVRGIIWWSLASCWACCSMSRLSSSFTATSVSVGLMQSSLLLPVTGF